MKNTTIFFGTAVIAAVIFAMIACAGGAKPEGNVDELDAAIREASDYLNTRIPSGSKVAFINISGGYPDLADYILGDLSKNGVNDGVFSVVDRAQLDVVRAELNFNLSGEVSDQSAQEIGRMLGAQTIVSGSVRRVGSLYRLDSNSPFNFISYFLPRNPSENTRQTHEKINHERHEPVI